MSARARIEIGCRHTHSKASEVYVRVVFRYPDEGDATWAGWVPIEYRRTGVQATSDEEVSAVLDTAYEAMRPSLEPGWQAAQDEFWAESRAVVTRPFFEGLRDSQWKCVASDLPANPNFARRIQDLKEMGYTIATDTVRMCQECGRNRTHLIMLRLPRGVASGYETWSPALRTRILRVLGNHDVYEDTTGRSIHLLPDHKFPEIRWSPGEPDRNPDDMSEADIRTKFQLISNQRNQQKREVCRACFQTGERGTPFGIPYFYEGDAEWPDDVPARGPLAEPGCRGCGWYDMATWRRSVIEDLDRNR